MIAFRSFFNTIALVAGVALGFSITVSNALTNVCVVVLLLAWVFSGIKPKLQIIFNSKITFAILVLLVIYTIGIIYTPAGAAEIKLMLHKISRLLLIPIIMSIFTESKWRKYALYSFWLAIVFSLLMAIVKVTNFMSLYSLLIQKIYLLRGDGCPFKDRIFTSLLFSFAAFSLLHYSQVNVNPCNGSYIKGFTIYKLPLKNIFYLLFSLLCFIYLFTYCNGRSGQVIMIGLLELFLIQKKYSWRKFLACNIILFGCVIGVYQSGIRPETNDRYNLTILEAKEYFKTNFANKEYIADILKYLHITIDNNTNATKPPVGLFPLYHQSTGLRLEFLTNSLYLLKTSPIIGYGTGSFSYVYNERFPLFAGEQQLIVNNPHNQYLLTAVELGLIGLLALLGIFGVMLYETRLLPKLERHLAQGVIFTIMIGCTANSWLMDFTSMHYFAYFLGICFAAMTAKSDKCSLTTNN